MTTMAVLIGTYGIAVVVSGFAILPDEISANDFPIALRIHIVTASAALVLGPWQFSQRIRLKRPKLHRFTGRTYVVLALVAATTGAVAAPTTANGPAAGGGFLVLGVLWFITTSRAFTTARRRDLTAHRMWATYSSALAYAGVMLRLYLGVSGAAGVEFDDGYPAIAWLCWLPNLILAHWLIRRVASRPVSRGLTVMP